MVARPCEKGEKLLCAYAQRNLLSSRAIHRVLKVARTIADLEDSEQVKVQHVAESLSMRVLDRRS